MDMGKVSKAIVAVIGGVGTLMGIVFGADVSWLTPELTVAIGSVLTTLMVYLVPNTTEDEVTE